MKYPISLPDLRPPCSRNDDASDDADSRTKMAWAYAMGLFGNAVAAMSVSSDLARLHDHKGTLHIILKPNVFLPEKLISALRQAWFEVAGEDPSQVEVVVIGSEDYQRVWSARRFA